MSLQSPPASRGPVLVVQPSLTDAAKRMSAVLFAVLTCLLLMAGVLVSPSRASATMVPLSLGTAVNYSVLGGTGVTSTGNTVLNGDVGVGPASLVVGFPPGVVNGSTHLGDSQAVQAQADFQSAYATAVALTPTGSFSGDQNGKTFTPGVYSTAAAFSLTGTMTLDGQGNANSVFVFQVNAALNTAASSIVKLTDGAQASNVFWQVTGAVGTGATSSFSGTILADGAITLGAGASLSGGALSQGLVTLADNPITAPNAMTFISPTPTKALTITTTDSVLAVGMPTDSGAITYASSTPAVCTVDAANGKLTYLTFGTCTIVATQAADVADGHGARTNNTSITVSTPTAPLSLGTAATYAVLGNGVTNTGATVLNGDLGVTPSSSYTGFPPGVVNGVTHAGDPQSAQALSDFETAAGVAAGRTPTGTFAGDQNGNTFDQGVYSTAAAFTLTGTMTLDGQNNPNAVFIFQVNAALNTAATSVVKLINGARAANVYWEVTGAVSTGASSSFSGMVMAAGAITVGAGASISGSAMSQGLVTLADNAVTTPDVVTFTSPPTPTHALTSTTTDTVLATGSSPDKGAITYGSSTPTVCSVGATSGALTYLALGTCTIAATQAADTADGYGVTTSTTNISVSVPPSVTVTFNGNGSTSGSTAPESNNAATALSVSGFSRTGYAFAGWNTAADGSGTAYADGASYPFTANVTLFAQWTVNASFTVTFNGNGSTSGATAPETDHAPSPLTAGAFSRTGYAFAGWNTTADGSGTAYADGATYAFTANTTLFAQWTINASFTVTFNGNGSTSGATAAETDHAPTTLTANGFSRTGYAFAGWNTAVDGSGTAYADGASYPFTANTTLFAQWSVNASFTVTFNGNGSTSGATAAETNHAPSALTANSFSRTGYAFAGWNTAADGSGTAYSDGATYAFTSGATLFAQWTINASFTVTFNGNGSTSGATAAVTDHAPSALSAGGFARTGYAFAGWNTAADGSGSAYADGAIFPFTATTTLFAQWTINASFTVTFNGNGSTSGSTAAETDHAPSALSAGGFARTGYAFAGWNTTADGSGTAYADGASYPFTSNVTLFAQWTVNASFTVTFNGNGSTSGATAPETNHAPTALSAGGFSRDGFVFSGWNTAADGSGTAYADGATYAFTASATLFAQWIVNTSFAVTFNGNGSTSGLTPPETNNESTALTANVFSRTGYAFTGWNTIADGTGMAYADGAPYPFTANATLFAQWTINDSFTVTFNGNGSTSGATAPETNHAPTALTANGFSRTGYSFAGWNTAVDASGAAYPDGASYPFTADATLFAQWTVNASFAVTFNGNGSTSGATAPETNHTPSPLTANGFSRTGYAFAGWNAIADGSGIAYPDGATYAFIANATLFAQWTVNASFTVTFNGNGSTSGSTAPETNHAPTALSVGGFSRPGYAFAGWNTAANGSGTPYADGASYPFTANATLFAQWTVNDSFTVTFNGNGSTSGSTALETNHAPSSLSASGFSRTGYAFAGWNTMANGSGIAYADGATYPFTASATLFAQWIINASFTVTFNGNGSTSGATAAETDYAPSALSAGGFSRTGYAFAGWNTMADGSGTAYADGATYPFTASVTLFAQWTINASFTVTFNGNGSTSGATGPETNHAPTQLTANAFSRTGYTFSGWNTIADGSGTAYADGATYAFTANGTLFAQWTVNASFAVTFNGNGSTSGSTALETDHAPSPLTPNGFGRTGYAFAGWNTSADGNGTAYADGASYAFTSNATLFAQWTVNASFTVTFNGNGSTSGATAAETNHAPSALSVSGFSRTGYAFSGWNTSADGNGTAYADGATFPFTANTTLLAQWTLNASFTVTFNGNGSTSGAMAAETNHAPSSLTANGFSRTGYAFAGWNTAANGSATAYADGATYPFTATTTLFAQWTVNASFTVTFNGNGSTSGSTAAETNHAPASLTANGFSRAGYAFTGWNTTANGSGTAYADGATYPFTANFTLFAQWTVNASFSVTFNGNGSTSGATAAETNHAPSALTASGFSRTGYTFAGWNTTANGTNTAYADGATYAFTANVTLFAQWTVDGSFAVTFNGNGSTSGSTAAETDHAPTALTAGGFARTGYTFAGWNTTANGSGTAYADGATYAFTSNATLFAQWNSPHNVPNPPAATPVAVGGYDLVGSDGGVFVFGQPGTGFYGSLPGLGVHVNNVVGIVPTSTGQGYFLVGSDGGVFAFGNAGYYGSLPGRGVHVNNIVGIVPTTNDLGYFLVGRDGGVFAFGNAPYEGSLPGIGISVSNVVGIAATPGGLGYWVVGSDGTVHAFGNATNFGSAQAPVTSITATPDGGGYWLTGPDGGIFAFGNAAYYGSVPGIGVHVGNIVSMVPSSDGKGYMLIGRDGGTFAFGDSVFEGSLPGIAVHVTNIVGAVPTL